MMAIIKCKMCGKKEMHFAKQMCHSCYNKDYDDKHHEKRILQTRAANARYRERNREKYNTMLNDYYHAHKEKWVEFYKRKKRRLKKAKKDGND